MYMSMDVNSKSTEQTAVAQTNEQLHGLVLNIT